MERIITYQITEETAGVTIRDYLRGQGYSHHALTELKKGPHGICLNDADAFPGQFLHPGDRLKIRTVISSSDSVPPAQVPFSIVYEDEDLLVLNKPAGTPVHPSMGNHGNTLANGKLHFLECRGALLQYERVSDHSRIMVVVNRGHNTLQTCAQAVYVVDMLSGEGFDDADSHGVHLTVPPETAYILRCFGTP